jgi:uncharacterized protein DUF3592
MTTPRRGEVLVGGLLAALGLLLLGGAWWTGNNRFTILKYWPTVTAEVTKSEAYLSSSGSHSDRWYRTKIEFRFEVDGKQFAASASEKSDSSSGAQMTAKAYAPGTRHTIRYNPANPNDIRFNTNDTVVFFLAPIVLGIFGLAATRIGLLWVWGARSRQPHTVGKIN